MNLFQVTSTTLIVTSSLVLISSFRKGGTRLSGLIFWLGLWTMGLVAILFPVFTVKLANLFGIYRGTDIVLYSSVLVLYLTLLHLWSKLNVLERKIGQIVSQLALMGGRRQDGTKDEP